MADIRDAFIVFSAKFYEKALNAKATVPRLLEAEWQKLQCVKDNAANRD